MTDLEKELAKIKAGQAEFERSPAWSTISGIIRMFFNVVLWILFWSLVVQCSCEGCVWQPIEFNSVEQESIDG